MRGQLALIRAIAARRAGKPDAAEHWLTQARRILPASDAVLAGVIARDLFSLCPAFDCLD